MKEVSYIDDAGYFIERRTVSKDELPKDNLVSENLPNGLVRPFWDGVEWVEGVEKSEVGELEEIRRRTQERREQKRRQKIAQDLALERIVADYLTSENLADEEKALFVDTYDTWVSGQYYSVGDKVVWEDVVYEVVKEHMSQEDWSPDRPTHLFKVIYQAETSDGETVYEVWKQPSGAHDSYPKGKIVEYENALWISTVENNVWQPSAHGWDSFSEG